MEETVARVEEKIDAIPRDEKLLEKIEDIRGLVKSSRDAVLEEIAGAMAAATEQARVEGAVEAAQAEAEAIGKRVSVLHEQVRAFPRRRRCQSRPAAVAVEAPEAPEAPEAANVEPPEDPALD